MYDIIKVQIPKEGYINELNNLLKSYRINRDIKDSIYTYISTSTITTSKLETESPICTTSNVYKDISISTTECINTSDDKIIDNSINDIKMNIYNNNKYIYNEINIYIDRYTTAQSIVNKVRNILNNIDKVRKQQDTIEIIRKPIDEILYNINHSNKPLIDTTSYTQLYQTYYTLFLQLENIAYTSIESLLPNIFCTKSIIKDTENVTYILQSIISSKGDIDNDNNNNDDSSIQSDGNNSNIVSDNNKTVVWKIFNNTSIQLYPPLNDILSMSAQYINNILQYTSRNDSIDIIINLKKKCLYIAPTLCNIIKNLFEHYLQQAKLLIINNINIITIDEAFNEIVCCTIPFYKYIHNIINLQTNTEYCNEVNYLFTDLLKNLQQQQQSYINIILIKYIDNTIVSSSYVKYNDILNMLKKIQNIQNYIYIHCMWLFIPINQDIIIKDILEYQNNFTISLQEDSSVSTINDSTIHDIILSFIIDKKFNVIYSEYTRLQRWVNGIYTVFKNNKYTNILFIQYYTICINIYTIYIFNIIKKIFYKYDTIIDNNHDDNTTIKDFLQKLKTIEIDIVKYPIDDDTTTTTVSSIIKYTITKNILKVIMLPLKQLVLSLQIIIQYNILMNIYSTIDTRLVYNHSINDPILSYPKILSRFITIIASKKYESKIMIPNQYPPIKYFEEIIQNIQQYVSQNQWDQILSKQCISIFTTLNQASVYVRKWVQNQLLLKESLIDKQMISTTTAVNTVINCDSIEQKQYSILHQLLFQQRHIYIYIIPNQEKCNIILLSINDTIDYTLQLRQQYNIDQIDTINLYDIIPIFSYNIKNSDNNNGIKYITDSLVKYIKYIEDIFICIVIKWIFYPYNITLKKDQDTLYKLLQSIKVNSYNDKYIETNIIQLKCNDILLYIQLYLFDSKTLQFHLHNNVFRFVVDALVAVLVDTVDTTVVTSANNSKYTCSNNSQHHRIYLIQEELYNTISSIDDTLLIEGILDTEEIDKCQ